jgi:HPt (histidine-containing phosphotransfer) domain-containing protein
VSSGPFNPLVNWNTALESVGGNRALLLEIVQAYLVDAPSQFELLRAAARRSDAATARRAAHTLKGTSRYFGAQAMVDTAWKLEQQTAQGSCEGLDSDLDTLRQLLQKVCNELGEYVSNHSPKTG